MFLPRPAKRLNSYGRPTASLPLFDDFWVATGRGMRNVMEEFRSAYAPENLATVRAGQSDCGPALQYVASGGNNTAMSGYTSTGVTDPQYTGLSEITVVTVLEFQAWWGAGACERMVFRKDQDGTPANAQISLEYFDDTANNIRLRFALSTSSSTGWTAAVDTSLPAPKLRVPYVYGARWKNGSGLQYFLGPVGGTLTFASSPHSPTGAINTTGGVETGFRIHHGGGAYFSGTTNDSPAPVNLYMDGVAKRALSDAELQGFAANPFKFISAAPSEIFVNLSGSTSSHTIPVSGTVEFSGSNLFVKGHTQPVSGNVAFSGAAAYSTGSGGTSHTIPASGAVAFSGNAALAHGRAFSALGSLALSGAAAISRGRGLPASGNVAFSGSAALAKTAIFGASGAVSFGGTGGIYGTPVGGNILRQRTLSNTGV